MKIFLALIFLVSSLSVSALVNQDTVNGSLVTVGAGLNTILTITAADDEVVDIRAVCAAQEDDGSEGGSFFHVGTYRKDGAATIVQVGFTDVVANEDCGSGANACVLSSAVSGTADIVIQADGSAGATITWDCTAHIARRPA